MNLQKFEKAESLHNKIQQLQKTIDVLNDHSDCHGTWNSYGKGVKLRYSEYRDDFNYEISLDDDIRTEVLKLILKRYNSYIRILTKQFNDV